MDSYNKELTSPLLNMSLDQLQQFYIESIPHHRALDISVIECGAGYVVFKMPYSEGLIKDSMSGEVHEGAITTLIDTVCGSATLTRMKDFRRSATLDLRVDFLRKGFSGNSALCKAECLPITGHVAFVRAVAYEGDITNPRAIATSTFAVFKGKTSRLADSKESKHSMKVNIDGTNLKPMKDLSIQNAIRSIPYAKMMGIDIMCTDDHLVGRLAYAEHLIGNPEIPALHGGTVVSLLQITATSQLMVEMKLPIIPRIFSSTIEYLQIPKPIDTFAVATIKSRSRRYANIRAFAYQERADQIIATATVQFLLVD